VWLKRFWKFSENGQAVATSCIAAASTETTAAKAASTETATSTAASAAGTTAARSATATGTTTAHTAHHCALTVTLLLLSVAVLSIFSLLLLSRPRGRSSTSC
jgi:hypothetical protein